MARWMRFMAIVGISGALAMVLVGVLGMGVFSSVHGLAAVSSPDPRWANIQSLILASGPAPFIVGVVFLIAAGVGLWQNMMLFHAGDDFHHVASTDTADLDYLARGLD